MTPHWAPRAPLVSVITPVLNRVASVGDALTSVAAQSYRPIEHVVVDGGSTDGTIEVIEAFARSVRPVRWISEPDSGMYEAIAKGIRIAKGDVLAYLNSDDLYFPWSAAVAVSRLQNGCDFVFGDVAILEDGFRLQFYRDFHPRYYTHYGVLAQPTVFWTRRAMETVGTFNPSYRFLGDVDYWIRAAHADLRFCRVDEVLALMILHPGALSIRFADELQQELATIRSLADVPAYGRLDRTMIRIGDSLRWRARQLTFRREARRKDPRRWREFIRLLRQLQIDVQGSVAPYLLPGRLLRNPLMRRMIDSPQEFERRLMVALRSRVNQAPRDP